MTKFKVGDIIEPIHGSPCKITTGIDAQCQVLKVRSRASKNTLIKVIRHSEVCHVGRTFWVNPGRYSITKEVF